MGEPLRDSAITTNAANSSRTPSVARVESQAYDSLQVKLKNRGQMALSVNSHRLAYRTCSAAKRKADID